MVDGGAFAAGVGESQGIVRRAVRNTYRYVEDGYSCWQCFPTVRVLSVR